MPITVYDNSQISVVRGQVLGFLKSAKEKDPSFTVIDVGGGRNPWAKEYTDAFVDINHFPTDKTLYIGNICQPEIWNEIQASSEPFDFSICTHVLEDVRDPLFVAQGLMKISKAGYISVPNKHTEFSNVESSLFLGYCHHRWIFTIHERLVSHRQDPGLIAMAKLPIVQYWNTSLNPLIRLVHVLSVNKTMAKVLRRLHLNPAVPPLTWVNPSLARHDMELGFRWVQDFEFKILNGDYAGHSSLELAKLYMEGLSSGV